MQAELAQRVVEARQRDAQRRRHRRPAFAVAAVQGVAPGAAAIVEGGQHVAGLMAVDEGAEGIEGVAQRDLGFQVRVRLRTGLVHAPYDIEAVDGKQSTHGNAGADGKLNCAILPQHHRAGPAAAGPYFSSSYGPPCCRARWYAGRAWMRSRKACSLGNLPSSPPRAAAASSGKLSWMSAALNCSPANQVCLPNSLSR